MQLRDQIYIGIVVAACLVGFYRLESKDTPLPPVKPRDAQLSVGSHLPDFSDIDDLQLKKEAFFSFMLPLVEEENHRIAALRGELQAISRRADKLSPDERRWLLKLAQYYRVVAGDAAPDDLDPHWVINKLLLRVDQVPPSLALAQAANESAWGTSRFAQEGNNLYGQWCFRPGCGLVPNSRPEGARYEVAKFSSPLHSVRRYIHNLNTHFAYKSFRLLRAELRESNQPLSGSKIVGSLARYSTRGAEYINELRTMIQVNGLSRYDRMVNGGHRA